jgi:hypothetical protein
MAGSVFDFRHTVVARRRNDNVANHLPYLDLVGAVLWIRTRMRIRLITLMLIRILIIFDADSHPDFYFMRKRIRSRLFTLKRIRIRILDQIKAKTIEKVLKEARIPYILAFHPQTEADPDLVPDPAYHFDADPKADPYFYLMRIRIQVTKMIRVHADPDADLCQSGSTILTWTLR